MISEIFNSHVRKHPDTAQAFDRHKNAYTETEPTNRDARLAW